MSINPNGSPSLSRTTHSGPIVGGGGKAGDSQAISPRRTFSSMNTLAKAQIVLCNKDTCADILDRASTLLTTSGISEKKEAVIGGLIDRIRTAAVSRNGDRPCHSSIADVVKNPDMGPYSNGNLQALVDLPPKVLKSVEKFLRNALPSVTTREPRTEGEHTQSWGQVCIKEGVFRIDAGRTPSQEFDKIALRERRDHEVHVANLGNVKNEKEEVVLIRSARVTSPAKVLELQAHGAIAGFDKLLKDKDGKSHLKMEIASFMDNSVVKQILETVSFGTPETLFLQEIQRSIDMLYQGKPSIEIKVQVPGYEEPQTVVLEKPSFVQVPFSFSDSGTLTRGREKSAPVFTRYAFDLGVKLSAGDTQGLGDSLKGLQGKSPDQIKGIFRENVNLNATSIKKLVIQGNLTPQQFMALDAIKLTLTGSTLDGNTFTNAVDGGNQRILERALKKELGIMTAVQCKSGQDRTGTAVALDVALDRFEEKKGASYDPRNATAHDKAAFSIEFTKAADTFCQDSNNLTRDGETLKSKGHPFFRSMYIRDPEIRERGGIDRDSPLNIRPPSPSWFAANSGPPVQNVEPVSPAEVFGTIPHSSGPEIFAIHQMIPPLTED